MTEKAFIDTNILVYAFLIITSVLNNNCSILYTEDIQHDQLVENRLRLVNPFRDCLNHDFQD
jgi:predicted nucleic acid-binding protein